MKTSLLALALLMSSLPLGLQLKNTRTPPMFDKYLAPAKISEFDYRSMLANTELIQDSAAMNNGVGVPHVFGLSEDHRRIICRVA